jgi:hypothetical protein
MFIRRKMWERIEDDIRDLQHAIYFLELVHDKEFYNEIMDPDVVAAFEDPHTHILSIRKTIKKEKVNNGK